jgi:outer membrane protein assembly factor BamE
MRYIFTVCFVSIVLVLAGCGSSVPVIKPFKMEIQQGNVVTSKMLLQLRPGMTKSQVKFIMGSPLIVDSFHKNRWDYFYQLRQAGKVVEQRRVILDFDKELLVKVRGDVVPEGTAGAVTVADENAKLKTVTAEPKEKDKSLIDTLKFWQKDEPAKELAKPIETTIPVPIAIQSPPPQANADAAVVAVPTVDLPNPDLPNPDMPSVLAVPIGGVLPDAPVVTAPVVAAPPVTEPAPVEVAKESPNPEPVPAKPSIKQDEPFAFRLDRNLDLKNLDSPAEKLPTIKAKKLETPTPEPEAAPGYFERMLEKIGF